MLFSGGRLREETHRNPSTMRDALHVSYGGVVSKELEESRSTLHQLQPLLPSRSGRSRDGWQALRGMETHMVIDVSEIRISNFGILKVFSCGNTMKHPLCGDSLISVLTRPLAFLSEHALFQRPTGVPSGNLI